MKNLTASLICLSAGVACAAVSLSELASARLFDANYATLNQSVNADAQFAKGSPKAKVLHEPRPTFDVEPTEAICHGLLVGEECASLRYESLGNLAPENGSIEIVFENREWKGEEAGVYMLAQCAGPQTTCYIYKHSTDGCGVYLGNKEPKWSCFPRIQPKDFKGTGRHHMVFNYSPKELRLYFDGQFIRDYQPGGAFSGWSKYFEVGPAGKFGRNRHTTICQVVTYNRTLTGEEIRTLAANRLPHLKLEDIPAMDKILMPVSRLLYQKERLGLAALEPDFVPEPFSAVQRDGACFELWNRQYDFGGDTLLRQITSAGEPMLEAPVALVGKLAGKKFTVTFAPLDSLSVDGKGRKVFSRAITGPAGISGTVTTTLEYDGAVRFDFQTTGLEAVQELSLRVPMSKSFATASHYTGATGYTLASIVAPDSSYTVLLPEDKTGVLLERPFCTHNWLGGTRGGVELFHHSDQAFWPKERRDCMAVERLPGHPAELVARYVPNGVTVPKGVLEQFTIGLIATPVRPMPKGWRAWTVSAQYSRFQGDTRGSHLVYWPDGWKARISLDPDPERARDQKGGSKVVASDHGEGRKIIPYWDHRHVGARLNNVVNPDVEYLRANFEPHPSRKDSGGQREYVRVHSATGYSDYLLRCIAAWGPMFNGYIDGAYIDEMENVPNDNARTGGGYTLPDGTRRITHSTYNDRDLYKRMDAVIRSQNGNVMPSSIGHCSGMLMMELLSHFQMMLTGEHLYSGYFPKRKDLLPPENDRLYYYSYSLPMDRVRTEFYHRPWGVVMVFLPCMKNQRDIMELPVPTRDLLSRIMHADILYWPLWCNADEMYKVQRWRHEFDIGNDAVEYIPYWENQEITCSAKDSCISFYRKNAEYLVIVSNLGRQAARFTVKMPARISAAQDAESHAGLPLDAGAVSIDVPRNDFRVLRLR